jgi:hypothetical protein
MNAEYWKNRNDANKLVLLCHDHHYKIHFQEWWRELNNKCKEYLWIRN